MHFYFAANKIIDLVQIIITVAIALSLSIYTYTQDDPFKYIFVFGNKIIKNKSKLFLKKLFFFIF